MNFKNFDFFSPSIVTWDFIIPAPIKNTSVASKTVPIVSALKGYSNL